MRRQQRPVCDRRPCQRTQSPKGLAEGVGFEPTLRFPVNTLSKRAPSATRPPLLTNARRYACGGARLLPHAHRPHNHDGKNLVLAAFCADWKGLPYLTGITSEKRSSAARHLASGKPSSLRTMLVPSTSDPIL